MTDLNLKLWVPDRRLVELAAIFKPYGWTLLKQTDRRGDDCTFCTLTQTDSTRERMFGLALDRGGFRMRSIEAIFSKTYIDNLVDELIEMRNLLCALRAAGFKLT